MGDHRRRPPERPGEGGRCRFARVEGCVELLDVDAAGLLLVDQHGRLNLVASSNEQVRVLELLQLQHDEGPCLDAFAPAPGSAAPT